jgi:chaperonin GroES
METMTTTSLDSTTKPLGPDPEHPMRVTPQKLRLLHDYVLVQPLAAPVKKGLLFMPENAGVRERNSRGLVLAVGPGDYNQAGTAIVPMSVQVGDLVMFGKYSGTEEEFDGQTVLAMRETECRLSVPAGSFEVVRHDDPKHHHLVEDFCTICYGDPEAEAAARLEGEREKLAAATSPVRMADIPVEINESLPAEVIGFVQPGAPRRPCAHPGCSFIQQLFTPVPGDGARMWIGRSCGHEHPADLEL